MRAPCSSGYRLSRGGYAGRIRAFPRHLDACVTPSSVRRTCRGAVGTSEAEFSRPIKLELSLEWRINVSGHVSSIARGVFLLPDAVKAYHRCRRCVRLEHGATRET